MHCNGGCHGSEKLFFFRGCETVISWYNASCGPVVEPRIELNFCGYVGFMR